jgi:hypothetical protein
MKCETGSAAVRLYADCPTCAAHKAAEHAKLWQYEMFRKTGLALVVVWKLYGRFNRVAGEGVAE